MSVLDRNGPFTYTEDDHYKNNNNYAIYKNNVTYCSPFSPSNILYTAWFFKQTKNSFYCILFVYKLHRNMSTNIIKR